MHPAPLTTACEYIEREISMARTRAAALSAGERVVQVLELLDFHEYHQLHQSPFIPPHAARHTIAAD